MQSIPECYAGTREEWREWLRKNHKKERRVYLISYKKHTGKSSVSHREALEEAICFGWIDTTVKRLDDEKYKRTFVFKGLLLKIDTAIAIKVSTYIMMDEFSWNYRYVTRPKTSN